MKEKKKKKTCMIKDPLSLYYIWKTCGAVYFELLKRFIDIPFVKTVRRISF